MPLYFCSSNTGVMYYLVYIEWNEMIEETAQVLKVEDDIVWVQAIQQTACGSCEAQKGCGHSLLAKVGQKQIHIPVSRNGLDVAEHDQVIIGVPEQAILKSSMIMYGIPLLLMILVGLICSTLGFSEGVSVIAVFVALLSGFVMVNIRSKNLDFDYWSPKLIRKARVEQIHIPMCEVE